MRLFCPNYNHFLKDEFSSFIKTVRHDIKIEAEDPNKVIEDPSILKNILHLSKLESKKHHCVVDKYLSNFV